MIISTAKKKFEPFSLKQRKILNWHYPNSPVMERDGIIADGAIRSGKTMCMSLSFIFWAMRNFNGQFFGMCGKTIGSFRRNVLMDLVKMLRGRGFECTDLRGDNLLIVEKNGVINFFFIFGGKDESSQDLIQGITLAGLFCDEVALMPESFVNQATGRCSVRGSKYWFNCNPEHSTHWFKENWIDQRKKKNLLYVHFSLDDNNSLGEKEKNRYRNNYQGVFYKRYILGQWCAAEGLIYDMYDIEKDPIDKIKEPLSKDCYVSIDYGTQNPCVFLMFRRGLKSGTWYITKEYYYDGRKQRKQKTNAEYLEDFKDFISDIKVKRVIVDPSATSFIAELKKAGFRVKKAKNAVVEGIRISGALLFDRKIKVLRSNKNFLNEIGAYVWDDKKAEDKPVKDNDHAMDAFRYFCATILATKKSLITFLTDKQQKEEIPTLEEIAELEFYREFSL